ncbi:hypothetical protein AA103196_1779 [Ameyamaea chiangmaiensis NBRC 103196]|uniref:Membrane integrity-associated transporter subunit PqiC n=1 Tax=Ameyamaea chiangmaiensis TaxID=442969 RepID=A0A850PGX9_9PROT|nr:PqiC family protein [Ameyamaea chiangmaiensis]MBS4073954.1 membrane integrity-associated transporter subunit PqiC [Ameyamaea chiangmaiensis]NVN41670.1 membrane integrity-associated transporter subunit PqiC [Ameyamaea chiangmaiensis]GBQ67801.1 hypothetical protein AA103196_1779 [Ameyamaea chiangmaiensis NBRC 103196]
MTLRCPLTRAGLALGLLTALAGVTGCASPPLQLYTLGYGGADVSVPTTPDQRPLVYVARVALPDYLDTQDMVTRDGLALNRSPSGRWAARLSEQATALIASVLRERTPALAITDQHPLLPPSARLEVVIEKLDMTADGAATLAASWTLIPSDTGAPLTRNRTVITRPTTGTGDAALAAQTRTLLTDLAQQIVLPATI